MSADLVDAIVEFLRADAGVAAAVAAKTIDGAANTPAVFYTRLPDSFNDDMPFACIVVSRGSGPSDRGYLRVGHERVDVRSYDATPYQARQVYGAAHDALKHLTPRDVELGSGGDSVRLFNAAREGGPIDMTDPDSPEWVSVWASYVVSAHETAIPAAP